MASSDDEGEPVPHAVSNYHFLDDKDEPVSFSELPFQWNETESLDGKKKQIFLHGDTDNGLQKICKQVTAWKFDLSDTKPEISVLSKENNWVKLQKPRKSFEGTIRTILITVHCLHFLKNNPDTSGRDLWEQLTRVFSSYEARPPCESDLVDHMNIISEALKRDEVLGKSKFLVTFLEEKPRKRTLDEEVGNTAKSGFIVDDDTIDESEEDGSDEESDLFDSVCSICDNGGAILCCEGRCLRSFHATVEAGSDSVCKSLGLSDEQVEAIQNFFCKNCQYKQHQCFSCGELGSSDKSSGAEVFPCVSATCGRFYHPRCVAKLLHRDSETKAEELEKKISDGEAFTCPVHKCCICKQGENKMDPELQFAICRRCPKSYHRKCLPREIAFEDIDDEEIIQRAWEGLMPNRILIYCLKHEIDDDIGTPKRNHIKFPNVGQKKKRQASDLLSEDASRRRTVVKPPKGVEKLSAAIKQGAPSKKSEGMLSGTESSKKQKVMNTSQKTRNKTSSTKVNKPTPDESKTSLGERLFTFYSKESEPVKSRKDDIAAGGQEQIQTVNPVAKEMSSSLPLDADSKRRISALMKDASSSITLEDIIKKHKVPSTHIYSSRNVVDKTITLGKVEGSIEALRAALQKLEEGCSIEDAKAVCEPGLLNQMNKWKVYRILEESGGFTDCVLIRMLCDCYHLGSTKTSWKNKLKVYLAPFLYGMRYTSFGRHFTKVDKLKEIVDMLHWYVQDGDMIVDFCCGANDFSCLMKKRLEEMGRKCSYKNYDVLQAKNDFNFEKRDWMSVRPKELPAGTQLIMGLNPPFGVNAALANKFIDKALQFKPKLLILIVPPETERLDKKKPPYDLVWEDDELLAGKSFYFPGSVDVNDKQIDQWNLTPPPLYLWSRPDWTAKHKAIAQQHGHLSRERDKSCLVENHYEAHVSDFPMEDHEPNGKISMVMDDHTVKNDEPHQLQERAATMTESHKDGVPRDNGGAEDHKKNGHEKNRFNENRKRRSRGRKRERGSGEILPEDQQKARISPHPHSQPNITDGRSMDGHSSKPLETSSNTNIGIENDQRFEHLSGSRSQFGTAYGGTRDDSARRYSAEPYPSSTYVSPNGAGLAPDYRARNSEEQFLGYRRENIDTRGYRPYVDERDEKYGIQSHIESQVRNFGRQDPDSLHQRSSYLGSHDPGFSTPYGHHIGSAADSSYNRLSTSAGHQGLTADSSYNRLSTSTGHQGLAADSSYNRTSTSAMQRYAPRLDELKYPRMNNLGSDPRSGGYDTHAPRPGFRVDSLGFAPGPYRPFSQQNSSGWLNE